MKVTPSGHSIRTVLVVDDNEAFRRTSTRAIAHEGRTALTASCYSEALAIVRHGRVDLAVIDLVLRGESGIELLMRLKNTRPGLVVVLMSGMFCVKSIQRGYRAGAFDCVEKPFGWKALLQAVEHNRKLESQAFDEVPTLAQLKWEYYSRLLELSGGNLTKAAALAGIRRTSLQRILRQRIPHDRRRQGSRMHERVHRPDDSPTFIAYDDARPE